MTQSSSLLHCTTLSARRILSKRRCVCVCVCGRQWSILINSWLAVELSVTSPSCSWFVLPLPQPSSPTKSPTSSSSLLSTVVESRFLFRSFLSSHSFNNNSTLCGHVHSFLLESAYFTTLEVTYIPYRTTLFYRYHNGILTEFTHSFQQHHYLRFSCETQRNTYLHLIPDLLPYTTTPLIRILSPSTSHFTSYLDTRPKRSAVDCHSSRHLPTTFGRPAVQSPRIFTSRAPAKQRWRIQHSDC